MTSNSNSVASSHSSISPLSPYAECLSHTCIFVTTDRRIPQCIISHFIVCALKSLLASWCSSRIILEDRGILCNIYGLIIVPTISVGGNAWIFIKWGSCSFSCSLSILKYTQRIWQWPLMNFCWPAHPTILSLTTTLQTGHPSWHQPPDNNNDWQIFTISSLQKVSSQ